MCDKMLLFRKEYGEKLSFCENFVGTILNIVILVENLFLTFVMKSKMVALKFPVCLFNKSTLYSSANLYKKISN